jgi:hypothetical protein
MAMNGKNRIYEPKTDGTYIVEFKTAAGGRSRSQSRLFVESGCRIQKLRHDKRIQPTILLALAKRPRE